MTVKLTDAQLVMLSGASQRESLCLTAPAKMKGAVLSKMSEKLVTLGLVREVRVKAGMPDWRREESGQSFALKLTAAGLKAIAVDDGSEETIERSKAMQSQPPLEETGVSRPEAVGEHAKTLTPQASSKLARVIDLLQRSDGATISNLIEATGWLPHTTRAVLTGLRKRGYAVVRERTGGGDSIYRVAGPATAGADRFLAQTEALESHDREVKPKANRAS
jgi:DNA-binding MarR family transcriptional regulator